MKIFVVILAFTSFVATEPDIYFLSNGFLSSPLTSAALVAQAIPIGALLAPVASVAPVAPVAPVASVAPVAPDYGYAYGSYVYQDFVPVVNSAYSLSYNQPYTTWFYRK